MRRDAAMISIARLGSEADTLHSESGESYGTDDAAALQVELSRAFSAFAGVVAVRIFLATKLRAVVENVPMVTGEEYDTARGRRLGRVAGARLRGIPDSNLGRSAPVR